MKVLVIRDIEGLKPQAGIWSAEKPDYARAVQDEWENNLYKKFKGCDLVEADLTQV